MIDTKAIEEHIRGILIALGDDPDREFIKEVYAAGCRNLQLDDCSWGMVVDPAACKLFGR